MSYRNVVYNNRDQCINLFTWDKTVKGLCTPVRLSLIFMLKIIGAIKLLFTGLKGKKKKFNNRFNRSRFLSDSGIKRVFENAPPQQQFLLDLYWQENEKPEFNTQPLRVCLIDIETYSPDLFRM
jgi:hypothetical protein